MLFSNKRSTHSLSTYSPLMRNWKLALLSLGAAFSLVGWLVVSHPRASQAKPTKNAPVESFDVGMKMRRFNIQLGTDTATQYRGNNSLGGALGAGEARSLSMSAEDLNGDGMPELITGYSSYGRGVVALRVGNINAIAPQTPEVFEGYRTGHYPSPFLNEVTTFELPEAPDFLVTGDFNADGYADIAAAARGSETVYLLPGDGRGNLRREEQISVPGQVTAMIKGEFNARDSLTDLIVGVVSPEGASALVFEGRNRGLTGRPEVFSLPGAASGFALGQFSEGINVEDLAASVGNSVVLVHGRNPLEESSNPIEVVDVPYIITSMASGNFLFDREGKSKLALLSNDGNVHFMTRGELDTRAYSQKEQDQIKEKRIAIRRGLGDEAELTALQRSMIERPNKSNNWVEAQTRYVGALRAGAGGTLMTTARVSSLPTDDLLFVGSSGNEMQILRNADDAQKLRLSGDEATTPTESFPMSDAPVAVVAARLSVDNRPSMVVLNQGSPEPHVILSVSAIFNVTKTTDTADGTCNADCSLREATVAVNHTAGSHTINVPNGTYTLTLGPFDDDFNFGGDAENSGDLDIIAFNLSLTGVSIVGASQAGTIVQMGTLAPAGSGSGAGIVKDRILEGNNFIDPQRGLAVSLSNMTFQNGASAATGAPDNYHHPGGAIMFDGFNQPTGAPTGSLTLTSMTVTNNIGAGQGGGITTVDATLTVQTASVVSANTCTFASGGGISYNGGNTVNGQTLIITGSTIGGAAPANGNTAAHTQFGNGGGIGVFGGAGVTIQSSSVISNNTAGALDAAGADSGGGGILFGIAPAIAISNSTISANKSKIHGGGMWVNAKLPIAETESTITLTGTNVTGNNADSDNTGVGDGGGIDLRFGAMTVQTTSHIDTNTAVNGGGIFAQWNLQTNDKPASLTVNTSSTIGQAGNGNTARNNGGGLAIDLGSNSATTPKTGAATLTSINLVNNTANSDSSGGGDGGGIYYDGNNSNFMITLAMNGVTIDNNIANLGGGDGMFMDSGAATNSNTISFNTDDSLNINGGTFTSTSGTLNLAGNFTRATAGTFNHNSGTVNFNGGGTQNINGTATSETFNNFTVNKGGGTLSGAGSTTALTIAGTTTLTNGNFAPGTALSITMSGANWTNNGGTFTPGASVVSFTNTGGGQAINGSVASQTFNSVTVAKTSQTLSVGGSTTALTLNGTMLLTSGTFSAGTATAINVGGDWTNNGGTFTPGSGTVTFNGGGAQNLNGTAATQTFNNFTVNKGGGSLTGGGSTTTLTVGGNFGITAGTFATGTITTLNVAGNWANTGTFTPGGSNTVIFNGNNNTQTLTGTTSFTNLTSNHTGTGNVTASGSSLTVTGLMRVQAGTFISSSTFNNVQIDSGTTLQGDGSQMNVSGNWTNNGGTFTPSGNTVNFNGGAAQAINGTAASQTFNNVIVNKAGGALSTGGSTVTLTTNDLALTLGTFTAPATLNINGNLLLTAGTFTAGTTINASGNWTNNGATFTPGAGTVVLNGNNNTQTLSGTNTFNNLTSNHTGTGGVTATGSTLTVTGLFRIQGGSFTSSSTFANVQIDSGTTLVSDGSTMNVSGNWTNNGGTFTPNGNTVNFNGGAGQTINGTAVSQTFNNVTVNKSGGALSASGSTTSITTNSLTMTLGTFTAPATLDVNGITLLTAGTLTAGTNITAAGNWTNNGVTFTAGPGTVTFDGGAGQTIGGTTATTFNNLTNSNASGLSMANDNTVNGVLALSGSDITVASTKTLTQPSTIASTGAFDVVGTVSRTGGPFAPATVLTFGNPNNQISFTAAGTKPSAISVLLAKVAPATYAAAVQRNYTITPTGGSGFTATLRLHYLDSELNGNVEASLNLRRGPAWQAVLPSNRDSGADWVECNAVTAFSQWTFSSLAPTASGGVVTGRIVDSNGAPVEGAVVRLAGTQNRKFITDANGFYRFENVETNGFYTVTPARANYSFSPAVRSFSQIGESTEATFGATLSTSNFDNPLDTPEYFVRQNYLDFLGREPDEAGFNFWSDQILECGNDNACIERRRENVSAAYFLSIEFQQTGGLVDGLYRAANGVRPDFAEFMPDTRAVGSGVVVGNEGWQALLQANKTAFVDAFVNRPTFVGVYGNMDNSLFVDTLISHTGVSFTSGERDALVSGLANGTLTRSAALRSIAENQRFVNAKLSEAFVMMEYFGYLRRDPDASGYAFWLNKLSEFNGNFERAEMVKAFIVSGEYRDRFPR